MAAQAKKVISVPTDSAFQRELIEAGDRLVVVDFSSKGYVLYPNSYIDSTNYLYTHVHIMTY